MDLAAPLEHWRAHSISLSMPNHPCVQERAGKAASLDAAEI